jgi:hypothetical protein
MARDALPSLPAGYSSRWVSERLEIAHQWRRRWGAIMLSIGLVLIVGALLPVPPVQMGAIMALLYGGFFLPWAGLAYTLNATRFVFDIHGMRVRHGPVPFKVGRRLHRNEIKALHVEDHGVGQPSWYIGVELRNGRRVYIIEGAERFEDAQRLVRVIAEQLELPDAVNHDDTTAVPDAPVPDAPVPDAPVPAATPNGRVGVAQGGSA